jgi:MFS family permease|tara:strand:- start:246 stop:1391 length:1146 start_codon:yes stop_codon:yes gene_type:complete
VSEEIKIFRRATLASVITSTYPMIVVGCYFGVTPWIFNRLSIDESDFSFAILLFGIFFIISNQIAGRILVPKYGTKLIMSLAFPLVTFSTFLAIISSSYFYFLLTFIPAGIGWGASGPIGGIHSQLIEKHFKKIITPYYAMGFNLGILVGGSLAGIIMRNNYEPYLFFGILSFLSLFVSIFVYLFGLPRNLDFRGEGEKFKIPETNVLLFGFLLFFVFGSGGIIMDWSTLWLSKDLNAPLYLASMGLIFFSIGGIFANLFSNSLIKLFTEKVVGCHFVMIGASIMFLSLLTNNFYIILAVLSLYGFAIANLVPIVIRQAVKQSSESIPMTVTNLITIGLSSTMIMPAAIGFLAETFSLTLNMYLLCIIVFTSGVVFLLKFK